VTAQTAGPLTADVPERPEFRLAGPLPVGTTVLEASAGTGKTYTIAALAARYVAEGHAELGQLMLVTFGRMATNELRSRVHDRLVALEARMAEVLAGRPPTLALDDLEALLISGDGQVTPTELELRHRRVARALADFDAATIATTHEFCLQMLDGLGVLGDREPQAVFVEQLRDLTREVATDLYLHRYAPTGQPPMTPEQAIDIAERAVNAVHTRLVPTPSATDDQSSAAERVRFAHTVRQEVERRKRSGRLFTYDDMLTRLRNALADPQHGPAAAQRLRERYRVVLVDEFQDTDPIQWEIIRRAFHHATTLILIGDPKQAIYAFRGADVASYLDAVEQADQVLTLGVNWRSDHDLVAAVDALMGGAALGDDQIVVRPVRAHHQARRLFPPAAEPALSAPIRLRYLPHAIDAEKAPTVGRVRPKIIRDLVADITRVLASDLQVAIEPDPPRRVVPADLAVLVRKNERGEAIRDALVAAGVPAVMQGASSVFSSEMADDWLRLLTALEQPRQQLVRQAALTSFFGWTFPDLAEADEDSLIALTQRVRGWSRVLAGRGVAALLEAAVTEENVPERLLGQVGGARRLTDLRHLAQSLHAAMTTGQLGIGALVEWLRDRMAEAQGAMVTDGTRRLETDAEAVTILTVHRSKGLEFPIVYLPEAWDRHVNLQDEGRVLMLHESDPPSPTSVRGECVLDVGGPSSEGRAERFAADRAEDAGEDLRLFYVAMTRAQCQVVTWWAPSYNTAPSALQRLLYRSVDSSSSPRPTYALQGDPSDLPTLGRGLELEEVTPRSPVDWQPVAEPAPALTVRRFGRQLDLEWRRTSYSGLTAAVHGVDLSQPSVGSEPEAGKEDDEAPTAAQQPTPTQDPALLTVSPMAELPMGPDFGTAVHAVFEQVDPAGDELLAQLHASCASVLSRTPSGPMAPHQLASAMLPALQTPLGPLAAERRLCDLPRSDQLAELTFEFPLAGGDVPHAVVNLGMVAPLLRRHLGADDPLRSYPDLLDHPALADQTLRGYLNGSIDAVLRITEPSGPRYLVVDYKTNWLGGFDGEPLTLGHYTPDRMATAMMQAHYPLQALLYSVAVHRMLRWRQPGYDPSVHLGGVLYLFVRGMAGADTPRVDGIPCGVFSWRPAPVLVTELSDLLDGVTP
jgi:exodeoxyribonuclease V beta subunit